MTEDELIELLLQTSNSGPSIRDAWLNEFVRHPGATDRLLDHLAEADAPTRAAIAELIQDFADAPRRNARKKRKKTQEPGVSWQRELAAHLNAEGPKGRRAKYEHLPRENEGGEPLSLCDGRFEITRRTGESRNGGQADLITCEFDDGRAPEEITLSTFERYLKEPRNRPRGE